MYPLFLNWCGFPYYDHQRLSVPTATQYPYPCVPPPVCYAVFAWKHDLALPENPLPTQLETIVLPFQFVFFMYFLFWPQALYVRFEAEQYDQMLTLN